MVAKISLLAACCLMLLLSGCSASPEQPTPTTDRGDQILETNAAKPVTPEQSTSPPSVTLAQTATDPHAATSTAVESTPPEAETVRIEFEPGGTGATIEGTLRVGESKRYVLYAFAGQIMRVYVEPEGAELRVSGADGTELKSQSDFDPFWRGDLPSSQDYFIKVTHSASAIGPWDRPLRISVLINPRGQAIQWVAYRDEANGFELSYSDYFALGEPPPVLTPMKLEPALSLRFTGSEFFQKTNLGEIFFVVSASEDAEILPNCTSPSEIGREQPLGEIEIDGVIFVRSAFGGVAAGNLYDLILHRAMEGGVCYEIAFYFHSLSVGAFPPEAGIVEFDREGVLDHLRAVLDTFRVPQR